MTCGVPQGSVLGPALFSLYISPLYDIALQFQIHTHQYSDDCQLYLELTADALDDPKQRLEACIASISEWMAANMLKLNDTKTELLVFSPPRILPPLTLDSIRIAGTDIASVDCVRDLGFLLEMHLNAERQVNSVCSAAYYHLSNIAAIRNSLSRASAEKLIHAFVTMKLDFCNALYVNLPARLLLKLQRIQYAAARIVAKVPKRHHMQPVLRDLHWLPVRQRIEYKVACITWQCVYGQAPMYLQELITPYEPPRDLRSASEVILQVSMPRTETGRRAFRFAASDIWNKLPAPLRNCKSYDVFKKELKTCMFIKAFN